MTYQQAFEQLKAGHNLIKKEIPISSKLEKSGRKISIDHIIEFYINNIRVDNKIGEVLLTQCWHLIGKEKEGKVTISTYEL